jgi:hypothetical protein
MLQGIATDTLEYDLSLGQLLLYRYINIPCPYNLKEFCIQMSFSYKNLIDTSCKKCILHHSVHLLTLSKFDPSGTLKLMREPPTVSIATPCSSKRSFGQSYLHLYFARQVQSNEPEPISTSAHPQSRKHMNERRTRFQDEIENHRDRSVKNLGWILLSI